MLMVISYDIWLEKVHIAYSNFNMLSSFPWIAFSQATSDKWTVLIAKDHWTVIEQVKEYLLWHKTIALAYPLCNHLNN